MQKNPWHTTIQRARIDLDESEAKNLMEKRAEPRDEWILAHWDQYVNRRTEPPTHTLLHRFDNSIFNEASFEKLIADIVR